MLVLLILVNVTPIACFAILRWRQKPPEEMILATELYRDFDQGKAKAEGQVLYVRGRVVHVGDSWLLPDGWLTVDLGEMREGSFEGIWCLFPPSSAHQAARLEQGQSVVIRGLLKGDKSIFGLITLRDCTVVR